MEQRKTLSWDADRTDAMEVVWPLRVVPRGAKMSLRFKYPPSTKVGYRRLYWLGANVFMANILVVSSPHAFMWSLICSLQVVRHPQPKVHLQLEWYFNTISSKLVSCESRELLGLKTLSFCAYVWRTSLAPCGRGPCGTAWPRQLPFSPWSSP